MNEKDQILKIFESCKDIAIISQAMEMPVDVVKAILFEYSVEYRRSVTAPTTSDGVPKALDDEMLNIIADVARTSKNEFAILSAAKYVRDDVRGRRDAVPINVGLNVQVIQDMRARQAQLADNRRKFLDVSSVSSTDSSN